MNTKSLEKTADYTVEHALKKCFTINSIYNTEYNSAWEKTGMVNPTSKRLGLCMQRSLKTP